MRHLISAIAVLAGSSTPVLAEDAAIDALVGLSIPLTVQPAGNTPIHAGQNFSVRFAPDGELLISPPEGVPAPTGLPSTYSVDDADAGDEFSTTYQVTLTLNLIYIKDLSEPAGPVPTPMPYQTIANCQLEMRTDIRALTDTDCVFPGLPDGGSVTVGAY